TASSPLYLKGVTTLAFSSATLPLSDSTRDVGDLRAFLANAVVAMFRSLVLFMVRGLSQWAHRTPLRNQLLHPVVAHAAHDSAQPELAWTITPVARTSPSRDAATWYATESVPPRRAAHHLIRQARPDESPGRWSMTGTDEKRNPDQR